MYIEEQRHKTGVANQLWNPCPFVSSYCRKMMNDKQHGLARHLVERERGLGELQRNAFHPFVMSSLQCQICGSVAQSVPFIDHSTGWNTSCQVFLTATNQVSVNSCGQTLHLLSPFSVWGVIRAADAMRNLVSSVSIVLCNYLAGVLLLSAYCKALSSAQMAAKKQAWDSVTVRLCFETTCAPTSTIPL